MTNNPSNDDLDEEALRPTETEHNATAERGLKLLLEHPETKAVRIDSNPNPMYVTIEDGDFTFWAYNYTRKCQEQVPVEEAYGPFETTVDQLHAYANDGYPIHTVAKHRIDTDAEPEPTSLGDFV